MDRLQIVTIIIFVSRCNLGYSNSIESPSTTPITTTPTSTLTTESSTTTTCSATTCTTTPTTTTCENFCTTTTPTTTTQTTTKTTTTTTPMTITHTTAPTTTPTMTTPTSTTTVTTPTRTTCRETICTTTTPVTTTSTVTTPIMTTPVSTITMTTTCEHICTTTTTTQTTTKTTTTITPTIPLTTTTTPMTTTPVETTPTTTPITTVKTSTTPSTKTAPTTTTPFMTTPVATTTASTTCGTDKCSTSPTTTTPMSTTATTTPGSTTTTTFSTTTPVTTTPATTIPNECHITPTKDCCIRKKMWISLEDDDPVVLGKVPFVNIMEQTTGKCGCNAKILLNATFQRHGHGDPCQGCTNVPECGNKMLRIDLEMAPSKTGVSFHVGDSRTNNGYKGDASTQEKDAEFLSLGYEHMLYGSDQCPNMSMIMTGLLSNSVTSVTIFIGNEFIRVSNNHGYVYELFSECLISLNGQSDPQGPVNEDIFIGLNRIIDSSSYRDGTGVCSAVISWACPWSC